MKNKLIVTLFSIMLIPILASAQWDQDTTFVPQGDDTFFEVHGLAVDAEGKIWIASYYWVTEDLITQRDINDDGEPDTISTGAIYVYNPDGTPADFSPLIDVEYADGTADTLYRVWNGEAYEAYSGRGMTSDANGDIVFSSWNRLIKIDHTDGMGLAKAHPDIGSLTEATSDADGNIYVSAVVGSDAPIVKYDTNLENREDLLTMTGSFSRDLQVSEDGNTIWWAGYTLGSVLKYTKPDEFSGFNATPDTVLRGIKSEDFFIHPITKYLWVGSGSLNDVPGEPYQPQTWYAFDRSTLGTTDEVPLDSIRWAAGADVASGYDNARPRGLGFSPDGKTAYVAGFNALDTDVDVQKFTTDQVFVSAEEEDLTGIPEGYELKQNYPNPFNPTTNINFTIKDAGDVTLKVYDMTGREVANVVNRRMSAGTHTVEFNASNLASGVYIYALDVNGLRLTNKMTLIK